MLARLAQVSQHIKAGARRRGLDVGTAAGIAVVPLLLRDMSLAIAAANAPLEAGFFVPPIVQIAVPKDLPRLRFFRTPPVKAVLREGWR